MKHVSTQIVHSFSLTGGRELRYTIFCEDLRYPNYDGRLELTRDGQVQGSIPIVGIDAWSSIDPWHIKPGIEHLWPILRKELKG